MLNICVATTVHYALDTRIYYKQVNTLSKYFNVDYYAQRNSIEEPKPSGKFVALPRAKKRIYRLIINIYLIKLLINSNYHVYHFHDPELLLLAICLKIRKKKIIFDIHENISDQIKNKEWLPFIFRKILSYICLKSECYYHLLFDFVILAEDSYLKTSSRQENVEVIHNYPFKQEQENVKTEYNGMPFKIVYVGNIREVRGVMQYLEIAKMAKQCKLDVKLLIIGPFADEMIRKKSVEYINDNDLGNYVDLLGQIKNKDVYKILKKCDLGLALLHPIENYASSYPTKVFEYMSVGLPVLTSNFDLWKTIIEENDCGHTANPLNVHDAFNIVKQYYLDRTMEKNRGQKGLELINKSINWEDESMKLYEIYKQYE